ncbi:MAG TPA: hypothetical protein VMG39_01305, partial [Pseudolabrys sp.]|nr:hypothetical protein [Pseudolabrys sp.]
DCAIAGLAMAATAAPVPSAARNLRRFIRDLPLNAVWLSEQAESARSPYGVTMRPGRFLRKPPWRKLVTYQAVGRYWQAGAAKGAEAHCAGTFRRVSRATFPDTAV